MPPTNTPTLPGLEPAVPNTLGIDEEIDDWISRAVLTGVIMLDATKVEIGSDCVDWAGALYHFVSSDLNSRVGDHIEVLAKLRNLALEPLLRSLDLEQTTVVFLNDVAICSEDILELVHQRGEQNADMTCAMDWTYVGQDPTFYDVWIARGITGDSFFNIPEDGNWNSAWNLFWNDPIAQNRLSNHQPF